MEKAIEVESEESDKFKWILSMANISENQLKNLNIHRKIGHGRTQSELPTNIQLFNKNQMNSNKKLCQNKWESPLSEKEFDSSSDVFLVKEEDDHSRSAGNNDSNETELTPKIIDTKSIEKALSLHLKKSLNTKPKKPFDILNKAFEESSKQSPKEEDFEKNKSKKRLLNLKNSLSKKEELQQNFLPLNNNIWKNFEKMSEIDSDTKNHQFNNENTPIHTAFSEQDLLLNKNIISCQRGNINLFSKKINDEKDKNIVFENEKSEKLNSVQNLQSMKNHEEKKDENNGFKNESKKQISIDFLKKQSIQELALLENFQKNEKKSKQYSEPRELTVAELKESIDNQSDIEKTIMKLNSSAFEKTHIHVWQKTEIHKNSKPINFINLIGQKSLKVIESFFGHLDSIRKLEFLKSDENSLTIATFSDDFLIKVWKISLKQNPNDTNVSNQPFDLDINLSKKPSNFLHAKNKPHEIDVFNGFSINSKIKPEKPTFLFSSQQNINPVKPPIAERKRTQTIRTHVAPIFSSHVSNIKNQSINVFSGDSKGNANFYIYQNEELKFIKNFKTGSEPCWSLCFLEPDLLVTSTPNKLKIFNISRSSEKKEEFLYFRDHSFFGQMRKYSDTTFCVNTYSSFTFKNEFVFFDIFKQSEAAKIQSSRLFSNSFALIPKSDLILSANEDKTVSIYDVREKCESSHFFAHSDAVIAIDVNQNLNHFVTAGADSSIRLWDFRNLRIISEIKAHRQKLSDSVFDVKFDPSGRFVASSGADGVVKIFHF